MGVLFKIEKFKSLRKGRVIRYLTYAFGEIILIFLAINLAVWYNVQRDEQIGQSTERSILRGILHNLHEDEVFFPRMVTLYEDELIRDSLLLSSNIHNLSLSQIRSGLTFINAPYNWVQDKSYQELLLLDDKGLVRNQSLLSGIDHYYGNTLPLVYNWTNYDYDHVQYCEKVIDLNDHIKLYREIVPQDIDTIAYKAELAQFVQSPQVNNILQFDYYRKRSLVNNMTKSLSEALDLKDMITQELEGSGDE